MGKILFVVFLMLAIVIGGALYWTWAMWTIWGWYAPLLKLPAMSYLQIFAARMLFYCLQGGDYKPNSERDEGRWKFFGHVLLSPLMAVAFAWLMLKILT